MAQKAQGKAARILQIEQLLLAHPDGLTQADLARRLDVHRSTIHRDLKDLDQHFAVYDSGDGRIAVDRDSYLTNVRFTLHEAMAVHLASRLMAATTDKHNPHAASALRKLAGALESLAPFISDHVHASADLMDDDARRHDPVYSGVLQTLTNAWSLGRKVHLTHQMPDKQTFPYTFAPYYIEPYPAGRTSHVIGRRWPPDALRTFKIERIRAIALLDDTYTIPADFNPRDHLRDAWGIWTSDDLPVDVVLRFHPRVALRVLETTWHRGETKARGDDGWVTYQVRIAEPREMLPWIRGWGADVEVVAPEEVRRQLVQEAIRLAARYGLELGADTPELARLCRCWGKTSRYTDDFHPALFHMLDTGNVAAALLGPDASPRWRSYLARAFGVRPETLSQWLPYAVALHDLGKISAAFQMQNRQQLARLRHEGFHMGAWRRDLSEHHTEIGRAVIYQALEQQPVAKVMMHLLMIVAGGHHGVFLPGQGLDRMLARLDRYEPPEWRSMRDAAESALRKALLKCDLAAVPVPKDLPLAAMAFTGFTILCDWLGSDERAFAPASDVPWRSYIEISQTRAVSAVASSGFAQQAESSASSTYAELFPDLLPARPLQIAIDDVPTEFLRQPTLTIVEAPTGEGKTEAALTLAHRIGQLKGTDEIYYALPTTATSNQMFLRLQKHLRDRLGLTSEVQLIHGQAYLVEDDLRLAPMADGEDAQESITWFSSKKRALLAPFGVGTVDQAELAALNVRHVALRLAGLAGKIVIFDEVHAYDGYMTTIVERLLQWLSVMGTSVILLSATLPVAQRRRLEMAYGATQDSWGKQAGSEAYPRLSITSEAGSPYVACPASHTKHRELAIHTLPLGIDDHKGKAQWLIDAVSSGGCVCWILNTVDRAQRLFEALRASADPEVDLVLLHARMPLQTRTDRERQLLSKVGRGAQRPRRAIIVGTQVLEQSLDLDFDVMVTDLAPIDLLLQRAGRLQRHDIRRPAPYDKGPTLWIQTPLAQGQDGPGIDGVIYDTYLLHATWDALRDRVSLDLPRDYRPLVEAVYGASPEGAQDRYAAAWANLEEKRAEARLVADARTIPGPDTGRAFFRRIAALTFEEDETRAAWIVAQTRLGRESIDLIPLERLEDDICALPTGERIPTGKRAPADVQLAMLRQQLRSSRPEIVSALRAQDLPPLFSKSSRLKHAYPLWLTSGTTTIPSGSSCLVITLDPELGLTIRRETGE